MVYNTSYVKHYKANNQQSQKNQKKKKRIILTYFRCIIAKFIYISRKKHRQTHTIDWIQPGWAMQISRKRKKPKGRINISNLNSISQIFNWELMTTEIIKWRICMYVSIYDMHCKGVCVYRTRRLIMRGKKRFWNDNEEGHQETHLPSLTPA